ncbi:MAG: hypothetical protein AAF679_02340 [Pseudomonadota bacterium]
MNDIFKHTQVGLSSPVSDGVSLQPSDTVTLPQLTRALYVGVGGDVTARLGSGAVVSFTGMLPGVVYPIRLDRVLASGTTASNLVGLW